ncbi:Pkinase-domain-containing protein [Hanseniaspora valbyensis NRRL Y-1626]|uniref:mitogen-activated protein kinase kinase n=1 Tax=Hanseniaspora valbyensis NRRL Y-1626 TaxID=766949 RepID=A0A1B7TH11_9ASCO|nr:Pkinase-domain-containing protein [Hanseniaspora valbyensis NRRL Y-1626]
MTTRLEKLDINGTNRSRSSSGSTEIDIDTLPESYWKDSDLMLKQIKKLSVLGEGSSGKVFKSVLKKKIFALKCITFMNYETKQILRELKYNTTISSENIVAMYGMFYDLDNIYICMEYMGGGSLDTIYKALLAKGGRVSEKILGKIAESGFSGLAYLHQQKIIHRDIKPSNILVNTEGQIKLCDFGVSGDIVNSLATTFTGTSFYMAPERIQGQPYTVTSDVWSMGLTLLEVAEARFPLRKSNNNDNDDAFNTDDEGEELPPIELLMMILNFKPELTDYPEYNLVWSKSFKNFIEYCLKIDSMQRPSPRQMLNHPWMQGQMKKKVNMAKFIAKCLD